MFELEPYQCSSSPDEPILLKNYLDYIMPKIHTKKKASYYSIKIYVKSDCFKFKLNPSQEWNLFFENVINGRPCKFTTENLEIEFEKKIFFKVPSSSFKYVSEISFEPNLELCKTFLSLN